MPAIEPYPDTYFGFYNQRPFADLDLADPDVDGDTLLDGEDDQDNDDFSNITELYETEYDLDGNGNPTINGRPGTPSIDFGGARLGRQRDEPLRSERGLAHLRGLRTLLARRTRSTSSPPTWRPHPLSRVWALCLCAS